MNKGTCKLCGKTKALIKSHIIPQCFYTELFGESGAKQLSLTDYPKRCPNGEYDIDLMCADCDNKIGVYDDYGKTFFAQTPNKNDIQTFGNFDAWIVSDFDYKKLKLFILSLLWRASETNRDFFKNINIGPKHSTIIKNMIKSEDPGKSEEYFTQITRYKDSIGHKTMMAPQRLRDKTITGFSANVFHVHGFKLIIHMNSHRKNEISSNLGLTTTNQLIISMINLKDSQEIHDLTNIIKKNYLTQAKKAST